MKVSMILSVVGPLALIVMLATTVAAEPGHHDYDDGHHNVDYYHEPKYSYGYGVNDHYTGDVKSATETRHNGWTEGSYSVLQPDGILRTVNYVADPVHGFRATVHNKGWSAHHDTPSKGHGWGHDHGHHGKH